MAMARLLRIAGIYLGLSVIAALGIVIGVFPKHPTTLNGWLLLLVLALPLTIAGEMLGEAVWRNKLADAVRDNTRGQSLSALRMVYALVAGLLLFAIVTAVGHFFDAN
jgi:hypothetical protein